MRCRWRSKPWWQLFVIVAIWSVQACTSVDKRRGSSSVGIVTRSGTGSGAARSKPERVESPRPLQTTIPSPRTPRQTASLHLAETAQPLMRQGQYAQALERLEKALAMDPSNSYLYFYLGQAHYGLGDFEASLDFLEVAGSMLSEEFAWMTEIFILKGDNWLALGSIQKARQAYVQALALSPNSPKALRHLQALEDSAPPRRTR